MTTLSSQPTRTSSRSKYGASWKDDVLLHEGAKNGPGCDSLDLLHVSSAVNEMFHLHEVGFETRLLQAPCFGDWQTIIEDAWQSGVDSITVSTSGSTGKPKLCTHKFASLRVEAAFLAELFNSRLRIVAYTPAHHIYGILFTALLPEQLGAAVVDLHSTGPQALGSCVLRPGDLVVSFPEGLSWIDRNIRAIPTDVEGVTSTAPCPRTLLESLMEHRLSRIVEVYGSSETAGIGTRVWPEERYRLMPHLQRTVSAPGNSETLQTRLGQPVFLMDHLEFSPDNSFVITGRKDGCVQVGGMNISLPEIEKRLRDHPDVAEAEVSVMGPEGGRRLACDVVPRAGCDLQRLRKNLEVTIAAWPNAAERPTIITMCENE